MQVQLLTEETEPHCAYTPASCRGKSCTLHSRSLIHLPISTSPVDGVCGCLRSNVKYNVVEEAKSYPTITLAGEGGNKAAACAAMLKYAVWPRRLNRITQLLPPRGKCGCQGSCLVEEANLPHTNTQRVKGGNVVVA